MSEASGVPEIDRPPFLIRRASESDHGYIRSVWCCEAERTPLGRSFPSGEKGVSHDCFRKTYHRWITKIFARPLAQAFVAATPEDASVLVGVAVFEPGTLHVVYVRQSLRGFGVATALLGGWKGSICSLKQWKTLSYLPSCLWDASASSAVTLSTPPR